MASKTQQKRIAIQRKDQCHKCQLKAGAKEPKGGLRGVTCIHGICPGCGKEDLLMYACDYFWPGEKIKIWD